MGGDGVAGTFTLRTRIGSLRGSVQGSVGYSSDEDYTLVLTVERGTFLLSRVTGTLNFDRSSPTIRSTVRR